MYKNNPSQKTNHLPPKIKRNKLRYKTNGLPINSTQTAKTLSLKSKITINSSHLLQLGNLNGTQL
jgi:hypothetical protein